MACKFSCFLNYSEIYKKKKVSIFRSNTGDEYRVKYESNEERDLLLSVEWLIPSDVLVKVKLYTTDFKKCLFSAGNNFSGRTASIKLCEAFIPTIPDEIFCIISVIPHVQLKDAGSQEECIAKSQFSFLRSALPDAKLGKDSADANNSLSLQNTNNTVLNKCETATNIQQKVKSNNAANRQLQNPECDNQVFRNDRQNIVQRDISSASIKTNLCMSTNYPSYGTHVISNREWSIRLKKLSENVHKKSSVTAEWKPQIMSKPRHDNRALSSQHRLESKAANSEATQNDKSLFMSTEDELFNISLGEAVKLHERFPEKVESLESMLYKYLENTSDITTETEAITNNTHKGNFPIVESNLYGLLYDMLMLLTRKRIKPDVVITNYKISIQVHQIILWIRFKSLWGLLEESICEIGQAVVALETSDDLLVDLVLYMYTGFIRIQSTEMLQELNEIAVRYKITDLADICSKYEIRN